MSLFFVHQLLSLQLDAKKANCHRHMHTLTDHETSITSLRIEVGDWKDKANHLRNTVNAKQNELDEMIADADAKQKQAAVDARIKVEQAREAVIAKADQEMNELQRSFEVAKLEFEGEISELVAQ